MNKNLYGLMNWPEIEGIVYAECDKPKELLGAHVTGMFNFKVGNYL